MSTRMRSILRGAATGAAAVALVGGAAACTGGEQEPPDGAGATTTATQPGATSRAPSTETTPSEAAADSPFRDEQLEAASQRFVDLLHVLDDRDWEAACDVVLDPTTGTAPEGERLQQCADGVEPMFGELTAQLDPGDFDAIDASMVEATDTGEDTVSLSVLGQDLGIPMVPGEDGRWYLVIPF